jgi:hypothetical protein
MNTSKKKNSNQVHCAPLGVRNPLKFKKNMTLVKKGQRSNKKKAGTQNFRE